MYYIYIIYSTKLRKFYTGYTFDVEKRVREHNAGSVPFTSRGKPWKLVYYEAFLNKKDALKEEKFMKTGKGRERRKYLLNEFCKEMKI